MKDTPQTPQSRPAPLTGPAVDALLRDPTPWLSCEDCFEQMDAYAEGAVRGTHPLDEAMTTHLRACPACEEEARSLIELLRAE